MAKRWHVIECFEGKDKETYGRLAAMGFEVWRPTLKVRVSARWEGRKLGAAAREWKFVPLFGRYLFARVEMSDSVFGAVIEQPGVYSWVCWAGSDDPAIVPDELIEHYRTIKAKPIETTAAFAPGDKVRVIGGAFGQQVGIVNRVDSRGTVVVELPIFGRPTPAPFPVGHVELVEQGRRPPIERDVKQRPRKRA